jgi:hypothetical protein
MREVGGGQFAPEIGWSVCTVFRWSVCPEYPPFVQNYLSLFPDGQEKRTALISLLAIVSGVFPTITGNYDNKIYHLNIYVVIVAPPSAGKSIAQWARTVVEKIEDLYENNENVLFIPVDISFAALLLALKKN